MSYCRFGSSSAYIYYGTESSNSVDDKYICMSCRLSGRNRTHGMYNNRVLKTAKGMLNHMEQHVAVGGKIPKSAIKRLQNEIKNSKKKK